MLDLLLSVFSLNFYELVLTPQPKKLLSSEISM